MESLRTVRKRAVFSPFSHYSFTPYYISIVDVALVPGLYRPRATSRIACLYMSEDIRTALKPGMLVKVHQRIIEKNAKGEDKERIQIFEGMVLAIKHGTEPGATVTVRKVSGGFGVEKIFPIHSPMVAKIELVRQMKVRQARPYYIRTYKKKLKEVKTA